MTHEHEIKSVAASFLIDPNDRGIYKQSPRKITLIQGDHNSKRFYFRIPRYIRGHDTSLCDKINVHYVNVSTCKTKRSEDVYLVKDMKLDPEDENFVVFSWKISGNATMYEGVLCFLIEFLCLDDKKITYSWHTNKHSEFINEGMHNTEALTKDFLHVLSAWEAESIKNVTNKALEAANEIFGKELDSLKEADEENASAIQELRQESEENATAIQELRQESEENATAIQELTEAYNEKVIELDANSHNASLAASNAQMLANNALHAANNAQTSANEAQATANNAVEIANAAQDTSNHALELINEAYDISAKAQNDIDEHKTAYNKKVAELEEADETNATNLSNHVEAYNKKVAELEEADETNATDLANHVKAYNEKVAELKEADETNATNLANHVKAYNEKVSKLEEADETNATNLANFIQRYNKKIDEFDEVHDNHTNNLERVERNLRSSTDTLIVKTPVFENFTVYTWNETLDTDYIPNAGERFEIVRDGVSYLCQLIETEYDDGKLMLLPDIFYGESSLELDWGIGILVDERKLLFGQNKGEEHTYSIYKVDDANLPDAELNPESERPIQNKVVAAAIGDISTALDELHAYAQNLVGGN